MYLQEEDLNIHTQLWSYDEEYITNEEETAPTNLALNVIWADIPLVTDGAAVNVIRKDGTLSMHWRFVEP